MTVSATFLCGACGKVASTVTLVSPGLPDPRLTPGPPDVPQGVGTPTSSILPVTAQLSVDGGPISRTHRFVPAEDAAIALETGDAAALFAIDPEYAPFWCPTCGASYCREHFTAWVVYDDGFFDCFQGVCPNGHERELED
jgi:predicted RNA-binding Zn-ribbon protein involved in translation (DUF1610 family)